MNHHGDTRLPLLLLTVVLVTGIGLLVNRMPQNTSDLPAGTGGLVQEPANTVRTETQQEVDVRFQQAVMMLHSRQYDFAVAALHRVLKLAPKMPEAHANMGYALLGRGHHEAARDFFLSAIDLRSQQVNAYWGLAVSLEALCDIKGAIGAMRSYVHLSDPDDPFLPRARAALWEWDAAAASGNSQQAAVTGNDTVPGQCDRTAG